MGEGPRWSPEGTLGAEPGVVEALAGAKTVGAFPCVRGIDEIDVPKAISDLGSFGVRVDPTGRDGRGLYGPGVGRGSSRGLAGETEAVGVGALGSVNAKAFSDEGIDECWVLAWGNWVERERDMSERKSRFLVLYVS